MKRVFVLAFLPFVLFGLEMVNLIKNHSFEKEDDVWETESGWQGQGGPGKAESLIQDSSIAYDGLYSASLNTSERPNDAEPGFRDTTMIYQLFPTAKQLGDFDSLSFFYYDSATDPETPRQACFAFELHGIWNSENLLLRYHFYHDGPFGGGSENTYRRLIVTEGLTFNEWILFLTSVNEDFVIQKNIPDSVVIQKILLWGFGLQNTLGDLGWRGQKVYWDDIRLMGYADYDVGVKEILSPEVISQGESYTPIARIKNFGREPADSFLVIVEASDGRTDTLPWALPPDTEDTVTFATWEWPEIPQYFTVRTVMDPDESDADDELVQGITVAGIQEPFPQDDRTNLQVISSRAGILKVSFGIPDQQVGSLTLFDATGRRIERMAVTRSGNVEFEVGLASGVYIVRLECGSTSSAKKAVVLR